MYLALTRSHCPNLNTEPGPKDCLLPNTFQRLSAAISVGGRSSCLLLELVTFNLTYQHGHQEHASKIVFGSALNGAGAGTGGTSGFPRRRQVDGWNIYQFEHCLTLPWSTFTRKPLISHLLTLLPTCGICISKINQSSIFKVGPLKVVWFFSQQVHPASPEVNWWGLSALSVPRWSHHAACAGEPQLLHLLSSCQIPNFINSHSYASHLMALVSSGLIRMGGLLHD